MNIEKIVITGGPCAGKSTAMRRIQSELSKLGWTVLFIPETSTELNTGGITPIEDPEFQSHLMHMQLEKEAMYIQAAKLMLKDKILIVCDRGALDSKAYMSQEDFDKLMKANLLTELELRDSYGAVFHLVTAAKGAAEFYTLENNLARTETPEQAIEADIKTMNAWTGHPHLRVIDNSTDFDGKMKRLIREIAAYLGEPEPFEIERKFLIEYPSIKWLKSLPNCEQVEIIQTYLKSDKDEVRIRQRGLNGSYIYTKTIKRKISNIKRVEIEKRLSKDEYLNLLMEADTTRHQIRKTRYCLMYKNCYLEIDIYPFWDDKAILEIELSKEDDEISIPDNVKIIKEVTEEENFKNFNLAKIVNDI